MQHVNPIALAVPFFLVLIAAELLWSRARGLGVYRFADAVTDLACGMSQQVLTLFYGAIILGAYTLVYRHRLLELQPTWAQWLVAFVGVDFLYYWWHRLSHEVNFLWAAHIVHHQSEDYNLAVALRQSIITSFTSLPFYLPLALLGVPPLVWATTNALSTLYQFWIHTQLVGKVRGPVDWVINLPSHHRVHHAINPQYLDKNYGATLIVWDRLFGTYEEELEAPVYGITKPLGSFNPLWAQLHYWVEMWQMARATPRLADKLRVLWKGPEWAPPGVAKPPVKAITPAEQRKYDPPAEPRVRWYVGVNLALAIALTFVLMQWRWALPAPLLLLASSVVLLGLFGFGALLEGRRWGRALEAARWAIIGGGVVWLALP